MNGNDQLVIPILNRPADWALLLCRRAGKNAKRNTKKWRSRRVWRKDKDDGDTVNKPKAYNQESGLKSNANARSTSVTIVLS